MKLLNAILFLTWFPCFASAQTQLELDPITVTASLQPLPASRTGRNITSISGASFQKLPVSSLDELLRYVPGVEVQQRGPGGSQSDIVLRGGTFQQVLIILDGLRLNDPNTGHFNAYIPIAPAEIDRIEILKGASSALYGSEAVGGVIHIITKSFAVKSKAKKTQGGIAAAAGQYGLVNGSAGGLFQKDKTIVGGGIQSNHATGQLQRGTRGFFHNNTASLSVKHLLSDKINIALRTALDKRSFAAQNFYTTFLSDTASEEVTSTWTQLAVSMKQKRHSISLDAGYKSAKDLYQFNPAATANNNRTKLLQFLLTDHIKISNKTMLSTGLQYQHKKIESNDRGYHSLQQAAAFVVLNQQWNHFSVSPSLRADYVESSGTELVPQLNLSYRLKHWQLRATAGKTTRNADFTERYNNYNKPLVSSGSVGNPGLQAERSFSYEAGADYFAGKHFKISGGLFQRRQSNLIDWVPTAYANMPRKDNLAPTGTFALATNIAKVKTSGAETDIVFQQGFRQKQNIRATLGILWMKSNSSNVVPSFYLSSHAKFLTNFSAEYSNPRFAISATGIYKHRAAQKAANLAPLQADYFLLNSKLSVFAFKQKMAIFLQADNIFNKSYSDLLGTQAPGRWVSAGARWGW